MFIDTTSRVDQKKTDLELTTFLILVLLLTVIQKASYGVRENIIIVNVHFTLSKCNEKVPQHMPESSLL